MSRVVPRWVAVLVVAVCALAGAGLTTTPSQAADEAQMYVVQGLPDTNLDVAIDGKSLATGIKTAAVAGPFSVHSGSRRLTFSSDGKVVLERMVSAKPGTSWDVVVHLPASSTGKPVVTAFQNDLSAVPAGKAKLTVAHTAAVPPADIKVNGDVLFANVANGESLDLVVPSGSYSVSIVPTGESKPVYLGPLRLEVKSGSLNRVYAVGDPASKTMRVAVHVIATTVTGSNKPTKINTGTGGQAVGMSKWTEPAPVR